MKSRKDKLRPGWELTGSRPLDALLPASAVAIVLALTHAHLLVEFLFAGLGLVPLAAVLGHSTDAVAARTGPLLAGLLQATLGNASELILGIVALRAGLIVVVQASLAGSILSNLLLVLGLAVLAGGWGRQRQRLNAAVASTNIAMLFLAAVGLIVPAAFSFSAFGRLGGARLGATPPVLLHLSLWTAAILILIYVVSLSFQLRIDVQPSAAAAQREQATRGEIVSAATVRGAGSTPATAAPSQPFAQALGLMLGAVILIAILSELLVDGLQVAKAAFHGTDLFWGGIIFALIGNAAEHAVAITAAMHDEMDLAMAIGVGSSLQVALLLAPVLVFVSIALGHPMTLVFSGLEIIAVVLSVVLVALMVQDGETNWLEGAQLLAVYAILAAAFYMFPG